MANIKSAKKRIKVIDKKTARNKRVKGHIKTILKDFDTAIAQENLSEAKTQLFLAEKKLMQGVSKGTIHKNTASRKVSRLAQKYIKAGGSLSTTKDA